MWRKYFSVYLFNKLLRKVKVCDEKEEGTRLIGAYIYFSMNESNFEARE